MTNGQKIIIVGRYVAFLEKTAKDLGVLTGDVIDVIKDYDKIRKRILGK